MSVPVWDIDGTSILQRSRVAVLAVAVAGIQCGHDRVAQPHNDLAQEQVSSTDTNADRRIERCIPECHRGADHAPTSALDGERAVGSPWPEDPAPPDSPLSSTHALIERIWHRGMQRLGQRVILASLAVGRLRFPLAAHRSSAADTRDPSIQASTMDEEQMHSCPKRRSRGSLV
jgi:hypothetical protein